MHLLTVSANTSSTLGRFEVEGPSPPAFRFLEVLAALLDRERLLFVLVFLRRVVVVLFLVLDLVRLFVLVFVVFLFFLVAFARFGGILHYINFTNVHCDLL